MPIRSTKDHRGGGFSPPRTEPAFHRFYFFSRSHVPALIYGSFIFSSPVSYVPPPPTALTTTGDSEPPPLPDPRQLAPSFFCSSGFSDPQSFCHRRLVPLLGSGTNTRLLPTGIRILQLVVAGTRSWMTGWRSLPAQGSFPSYPHRFSLFWSISIKGADDLILFSPRM